jgi:hypothetical protein
MRYFFNLAHGVEEHPDYGGMELKSDAAARQEAALRAADPAITFQLARYVAYTSIVVRDETDRVICEVNLFH